MWKCIAVTENSSSSATGLHKTCNNTQNIDMLWKFALMFLVRGFLNTKAYEEFVKDTNGSIDAKSKDIVNKSETKAKAEGDRVEAKEDKEAVMLELEQLANYKAELHSSCDFVMKLG